MKALLRTLIPARYWYTLSNIKNSLWGYSHTHYSQFGEDVVLGKIFANKNTGVYVDIGAHHPKRYSNTYLLYKRGWHGTNVDPNPHTIALFNRARPHDRNVWCGVGNKKTATYYQFSDPAVNTFNKDEAEKWMHKDWLTFLGTTEVVIHPLVDFMDSTVDLLTIDAEGMDLEILKTNNWNAYKPSVVVVEAGDSSIPAFMESLGYALEAKLGKSLIYTVL